MSKKRQSPSSKLNIAANKHHKPYCLVYHEEIAPESCDEIQSRLQTVNSCKGCPAKRRFCTRCFHEKGGVKTYGIDQDTGLCKDCQTSVFKIAPVIESSGNGKTRSKRTGKFAGAQIQELPIANIHPNPDQPRKHFDKKKLEALSASLREKGQEEPVIVFSDEDRSGHYMLQSGERRWRAAQILKWKTLQAIVVAAAADLEEEFDHALVINCGSDGYTVPDLLAALKRKLTQGKTQTQIADMLGCTASWISQFCKLLRLDERLIALLSPEVPKEEALTLSIAMLLSDVADKEIQVKMSRTIIQKNMTINEARHFIEQKARDKGLTLNRQSRNKKPSDRWDKMKALVNRIVRDVELQLKLGDEILDVIFINREISDLKQLKSRIAEAENLLLSLGAHVKRVMDKITERRRVAFKAATN